MVLNKSSKNPKGLKVKAPKPRITRSQIKSIDDKYYGREPLVVDANDYSAYRDALNWYNYMHEQDQAREWLLEYMKKNGFEKAAIADVRRCPKYAVPTTIGWQARMMMNGNKLSESSMNFFNQHLDRLYAIGIKSREVQEVKTETPVISIQERTQAKIQQLITECEEAIDNDPKLDIYTWLVSKEASAQAATAIRDYYAKCIADHEYDELDSRAEKKARDEAKKYWEDFVLLIDRYLGNKKAVKVRKPREKKAKSAVDLVKTLSYQKEFAPLKIVSVNPAEIIGASQLWAYNTKTRKLTKFEASGPSGLSVKGASVTGFDVEKSATKRLRKPEDAIMALLGAGKVTLRRFMDDIKSVASEAKGRINTDTVLLRLVK